MSGGLAGDERRRACLAKLPDMSPLGLGVYSIPDAARLVRADLRSIRRWLFGHTYSRPAKGDTGHPSEERERHHLAPLWEPQYDPEDLGEQVIGFLDLLELRVVRQFVSHGVPLAVVRRCLDTARDVFGADHPLTRRRFVTDGETIYAESVQAATREGDVHTDLLNLRSRQYAFKAIIKDSLYSGIEYRNGHAARWFPNARRPGGSAVVLDPTRQFGHPMVDSCGIPTATLFAAFLAANEDRLAVARAYDISPREVSSAVRFEQSLRQAA